jgi:thiol-disulfide isomerase/thioredoxin
MPQASGIVSTIRAAIAANDFPGADRLLRNYSHDNGVTPEALEALSWLARGSLAAHRFAKAADYARRAHQLLVRRLKNADLDSEPSLASALGASIEVLAQLKSSRGRRSEAIQFLKRELGEYGTTSIGIRIRKNLNLLTMEGQAAPELEILEWLGPKPPALSKLHGRPVLIFFWAHYCDDSRAQCRVLVHLREEFGGRGLVLIGPTRRYGYFDEGRREPAPRRQETQHIQRVLGRYYSSLPGLPIPISERNFDIYGVSTTPTLVLIDCTGLVSLYHPGKMPYRDLAPKVRKLFS